VSRLSPDRAGAGPPFLARSSFVAQAVRFAHEAHAAVGVAHPLAVARLIEDAGFEDQVVAAALLHDVLEDTATTASELRRAFGIRVARIVALVTENPAIDDYALRKAALRSQATGGGGAAAAVFAADKLASVRELLAADARPGARRLDHFDRSLRVLRQTHPELPFLDELEAGLEQVRGRNGSKRSRPSATSSVTVTR